MKLLNLQKDALYFRGTETASKFEKLQKEMECTDSERLLLYFVIILVFLSFKNNNSYDTERSGI